MSSAGRAWAELDGGKVGVLEALPSRAVAAIDLALLSSAFNGGRSGIESSELSGLSRYRLCGYIGGEKKASVALLSVDGQSARPVRVGRKVEGVGFLMAIEGRSALFSTDSSGLEGVSKLPLVKCG